MVDGWSRKFCYGTLSDARDHGSKRARPRGLRFVPNRGPAPRGPDYPLASVDSASGADAKPKPTVQLCVDLRNSNEDARSIYTKP